MWRSDGKEMNKKRDKRAKLLFADLNLLHFSVLVDVAVIDV